METNVLSTDCPILKERVPLRFKTCACSNSGFQTLNGPPRVEITNIPFSKGSNNSCLSKELASPLILNYFNESNTQLSKVNFPSYLKVEIVRSFATITSSANRLKYCMREMLPEMLATSVQWPMSSTWYTVPSLPPSNIIGRILS
jgi:hypothetical protein